MSHQLTLQVQNNSNHTLKSYSVIHSWDGHHELLNGSNLSNGGIKSPSIEITSGYTQFDWYTIQLDFDVLGPRQTNFYCNSSYDQNQCVMVISDDALDCNYYQDGVFITGCNHKAYSGLFMDEVNQIDPAKHDPAMSK